MAVKMRLTRLGDKKNPHYRIVITDSRKARDGAYIDLVGTYNPQTVPATIKIDADKAKKWLACGVQPTDTVKALLVGEKIMEVKPFTDAQKAVRAKQYEATKAKKAAAKKE